MTLRSFGLMHRSDQPDAPCYATIPRTGKEWHIKMRDKLTPTGCTISGSKDGYGPFPFDQYWGVPVIDFTGESYERCKNALLIMDRFRPAMDIPQLPGFIRAHQEAGFKVILNGYEGMI